jgi:hypothetical protein
MAGFNSCVSDLGAFGKQAHRMHQAELLPPFSQGSFLFLLEKPLHGSSARTHRPANASEGLPISGIGIQDFRKPLRSGVGQVR